MKVRDILELVSGTTVIIYGKDCAEVGRISIGGKNKDYDFPYVDDEIYMITSNEDGIQICL